MSLPIHIEPEIPTNERAEWLALFKEHNAQLKLIANALEGIEAQIRELDLDRLPHGANPRG
jgi:hypothetical protein